MCLTVQNLFNDKEIILGREEIFKIAKYAIENKIIDAVWFEGEFDYTCLQDIEIDNIVMLDAEKRLENEI